MDRQSMSGKPGFPPDPGLVHFEKTSKGCRFRVKVQPGARRNALGGAHGDAMKISVTAPPERGKANEAVVALLAAELGVAASRVSITAGRTSRMKTVHVEGLGPGQAAEKLLGSRT